MIFGLQVKALLQFSLFIFSLDNLLPILSNIWRSGLKILRKLDSFFISIKGTLTGYLNLFTLYINLYFYFLNVNFCIIFFLNIFYLTNMHQCSNLEVNPCTITLMIAVATYQVSSNLLVLLTHWYVFEIMLALTSSRFT